MIKAFYFNWCTKLVYKSQWHLQDVKLLKKEEQVKRSMLFVMSHLTWIFFFWKHLILEKLNLVHVFLNVQVGLWLSNPQELSEQLHRFTALDNVYIDPYFHPRIAQLCFCMHTPQTRAYLSSNILDQHQWTCAIWNRNVGNLSPHDPDEVESKCLSVTEIKVKQH